MRVALLVNNWVGLQVTRYLRSAGEEIVAVILHPEPRRKCGVEILEAANVADGAVIDGSRLKHASVLDALCGTRAEFGISAMFGYIVPPEVLAVFPAGCVNLHLGLLPYNRGAYPNVWSIVDRTPAGVTIHFMDDGIDTGDVIAQREITVEPVDTGASLYRRLELAGMELFQEVWPQLRSGQAPRVPQEKSAGTFHHVRDVERVDEVDLEGTYRARDLINILRARTFPPHAGAFFRQADRKFYMELTLRDGAEPRP